MPLFTSVFSAVAKRKEVEPAKVPGDLCAGDRAVDHLTVSRAIRPDLHNIGDYGILSPSARAARRVQSSKGSETLAPCGYVRRFTSVA